MKIAVLGTGTVGRTLADKFSQLGHEVCIGTRDPAETLARTDSGPYGDPPFGAWAADRPGITLASFAAAARHGELIFNATSGYGSLVAVGLCGDDNLDGKILVDISNPLDFSKGMPPSLFVCNTDSLGEQIQRAFPRARVVKTLNTVNAHLMVEPGLLQDGAHSMFLCGNDPEAKARVAEFLRVQLGWKDLIDLGDISMARGTEMLLPIWVRLWGALKTPMFSIQVVR